MLKLLRKILAPWEDKIGAPAFFDETRAERLKRLHTEDPAVARELLEEARRLADEPATMSEGVERRATTLQGVVSIAATLAVAGGTLLLDPSKVHSFGWRAVLGAFFLGLLYSLIATAYRATQSSTQIHEWTRVNPADHLTRTSRKAYEVDAELSADLLRSYGKNMEVVRWKVTYLRAASEWFLRGLIFLGLIALTLCAYVAFHRSEDPSSTSHRGALIEVNVTAGKSGPHWGGGMYRREGHPRFHNVGGHESSR